MAKLLGISNSKYSYCLKTNSIPFDEILRFCQNNNISLDELFFDQKSSPDLLKEFKDKSNASILIKSLAFLESAAPEAYKKLYLQIAGEMSWLKGKTLDKVKSQYKLSDGIILKTSRPKLVQLIVYFLKFTENCDKNKLIRLLYFLDFLHFQKTGHSVTGLEYHALKIGPSAKELLEEFNNKLQPDLEAAIFSENIYDSKKRKSFTVCKPKIDFTPDLFSKRELEILEDISLKFKDSSAEEMKEKVFLKKEPWKRTFDNALGEGHLISYLLAIDPKKGKAQGEIAKIQEEYFRQLKDLGLEIGTA